ncbi:hypothetical protein GPECTOR_4g609 [Gonium pectorale]|uniref:EF-hand domain-containing protein n=1 Tax=Gonium pectorale TaxID=33097 RepID=A0A150GXK1_GONPE|nr:hypothetical protein GPECTOR_4g609 [Gonium pectorale]|eukprot:KXZ54544.1 hypothetical protein GPECTOR_4g609 [Gonium pectorale]
MPKLTLGFKKIRDAYAIVTAPTGKVNWGQFRSLCDKKLWLNQTDTLKEVLTMPEVDDRVPVTHPDLIIIYMVVYLIDARLKRNTIFSPEVRSALDLMEKSFMFFDSSADGCIERKELAMALKSGTRVFGRKASKTLADQLFDQLDWSKDGQITFKEYLVGMERIIIETMGDDDEDDEMECEEDEEEEDGVKEADWEDEGAKPGAADGGEVASPRGAAAGGAAMPTATVAVEPPETQTSKAVGESGDEVTPFTQSGMSAAPPARRPSDDG